MNIGINDCTRAVNITPARSVCTLFLRPMPGQDLEPLLARIRAAAQHNGLSLTIPRGEPPFYTDPAAPYVQEILKLTDTTQPRTVNFGTDASRLAELDRLIVLGPGNIEQAHTAQEYVTLTELERGTALYARLVQHWCQP
jgi:acetylornithine deacetylase